MNLSLSDSRKIINSTQPSYFSCMKEKDLSKKIVMFFVAIFLFVAMSASAQSYWTRTFGGDGSDVASFIEATSDGGFIVAGYTESLGAGLFDLWILKMDYFGNIQWEKAYGGNNTDAADSIKQTPDGGYVVSGRTGSFGAGAADFWILKLDSSGNIQWQRTYGGNGTEYALSIQTTSDGGYIVAGQTSSFGAGFFDVLVLKLDSAGEVQWQKTYGNASVDVANSIQETSDGGFIVVGATGAGAASIELLILKLDSLGNIEWQKRLGGAGNESGNSIQLTSDGGFIVAGYTDSFGSGSNDFWVLKFDSAGNVQWQKTYGAGGDELADSIQTTSDGGYIVAGDAFVFSWNFWVLKLDSAGNIQWQKLYGGSDHDFANAVVATSDGRILFAGRTFSYADGSEEAWILKLNSNGEVDSSCSAFDTVAVPANSTVVPQNSSLSTGNPTLTLFTPNVGTTETAAMVSEQCSSTCLFCDDFEDDVLNPGWTYEKPAWSETGGFLVGTPAKRKAIAVASPAFAGCTNCDLTVSVKTAGGSFNKIWIYMHRVDKRTLTELLIKEESDKVVLKQRINKTVVAKNKANVTIHPNTEYIFRISFDGTQYNVSMNGTLLFTMDPEGPVPNATVGAAAKSTAVSIGHISVD